MCHPSATMVYDEIHKTDPKISRATVFRVLADLAENGILRRIKISGVDDRFDFTLAAHHHVRCRACGRIDDIILDKLPPPAQSCSDTRGYTLETFEIGLCGLCPECSARTRDT